MDSVMRKADELDRLVGELVSLDEQRVGIGTKLVELEHYFPQGRLPRVVAACAGCLHDAVPGTRPRARRRDARISVDPARCRPDRGTVAARSSCWSRCVLCAQFRGSSPQFDSRNPRPGVTPRRRGTPMPGHLACTPTVEVAVPRPARSPPVSPRCKGLCRWHCAVQAARGLCHVPQRMATAISVSIPWHFSRHDARRAVPGAVPRPAIRAPPCEWRGSVTPVAGTVWADGQPTRMPWSARNSRARPSWRSVE